LRQIPLSFRASIWESARRKRKFNYRNVWLRFGGGGEKQVTSVLLFALETFLLSCETGESLIGEEVNWREMRKLRGLKVGKK
jgi:hypothetical protein